MLYYLGLLLSRLCDKLGRVVYITGAAGTGLDIYLVRYVLFKNKYFSAYLHRFLRSDRDDFHDHPWNFWTLMLKGQYYEHTPTKITYRSPGLNRLAHRKAEDLHKIMLVKSYTLKEVDDAPFTLFFASRRRKNWGFLKDGKILPWREYLREDYNEHTKEVILALVEKQKAGSV
jgi:hypothetical protein